MSEYPAFGKQLHSHISSQIKGIFLCKPSEKARAKVRNSIVCQWLPVVILLLTRK